MSCCAAPLSKSRYRFPYAVRSRFCCAAVQTARISLRLRHCAAADLPSVRERVLCRAIRPFRRSAAVRRRYRGHFYYPSCRISNHLHSPSVSPPSCSIGTFTRLEPRLSVLPSVSLTPCRPPVIFVILPRLRSIIRGVMPAVRQHIRWRYTITQPIP